MIFWRVLDNNLYTVGNVDKLGFEKSEGFRIPDEYLEKKEFTIMRTAHGVGDWGIISAMPKLIKEKYPDSKVYVPSVNLLEKLFGQMKSNWGTWDNPFKNVEYILQNGIIPCVAKPAAKVTACCSAIPTSKDRDGIFSIIIFNDDPEGIAGVMPMIFLFFFASSTIVSPNIS